MPTDVAEGRHGWSASPDGHYRYDDPWTLIATEPATGSGSPDPTLFSLGNGYLGVRGSVLGEVDSPTNVAIVNGLYERWTMSYPEVAFGFATEGQTLLTAPSPVEIEVIVDDVVYSSTSSNRLSYRRSLAMDDLTHTESIVWDHPTAGRISIEAQRFVSMATDSIVGARVDVAALDKACEATVRFTTAGGQQRDVGGDPTDPRRSRNLPADAVRTVLAEAFDRGFATCIGTTQSGMQLGLASRFDTTGMLAPITPSEHSTVVTARQSIGPDETMRTDRVSSYQLGEPTDRPADLLAASRAEVGRLSYDAALVAHRSVMAERWQQCDIELDAVETGVADSRAAEQQAVRFALLQLMQSGARTRSGVAAKGVSSNGYEGHYFWDTEAFMVPFWQYADVERARHLLSVRHRQLPIARDWAAHLKHDGAFFAWRTINGHEASGYFPAGTAQIHVNADIAVSVARFLGDYPDDEFLLDGVEMLVEIARFFVGYGFVGDDGAFHLHCVTGPDEYTALVDDNYYTNRSVQAALRAAAEIVALLDSPQMSELVGRVGFEPAEAERWADVADRMHLGYCERLGIRPQDNSFLSKQRWDFSNGGTVRPLLLDQHPTTIYRHQVLKQPDVVLADFMFGWDEDPEVVRRNFDYYEALTTGDSSLSAGIQGAVAARVGYDDVALGHFHHALWTDLDNLHGNTADGIHVATAGSIWLCLVRGLAGIMSQRGLTIDPRLPRQWAAVRVPYVWRGNQLRIEVSAAHVEIQNQGSETVEAVAFGVPLTIAAGATGRVG